MGVFTLNCRMIGSLPPQPSRTQFLKVVDFHPGQWLRAVMRVQAPPGTLSLPDAKSFICVWSCCLSRRSLLAPGVQRQHTLRRSAGETPRSRPAPFGLVLAARAGSTCEAAWESREMREIARRGTCLTAAAFFPVRQGSFPCPAQFGARLLRDSHGT